MTEPQASKGREKGFRFYHKAFNFFRELAAPLSLTVRFREETEMKVNEIDAIIIRSEDPKNLADFYQKLGIELTEEDHGNGVHYGARLGRIHFAIHAGRSGNQSVSFSLDDVDGAITELKESGAKVTLEPTDRPYGRLASIEDPEGNEVFFHKY